MFTVLSNKKKSIKTDSDPTHLDGYKIIDQFERTFDYLRLAVNERCNLRCIYCMPEEGIHLQSKEKLLTTEEIVRIIHILADEGVKKIRFTGGEPLLHKDIIYLISEAVRTPGIDSVHLTTNGLLLGTKLIELFESGLDGINIGLSTLDPRKYIQITRKGGLEELLRYISMALEKPFGSVKLNVVMMRNYNYDEIEDFVELTRDNRLTVRFIELMPFDGRQVWRAGTFLSAEKIVKTLRNRYGNLVTEEGSATEKMVFRLPNYTGKFAVIPAFTRSLCGGCNRIRLTADGVIRNCLYSGNEFNVKSLIRDGISNREIASFFRQAMWIKLKDGRDAERQGNHFRESMTQIGG